MRLNGLDPRHKPGSIPKVNHDHHMHLLFDGHSSVLLALYGNTDLVVPGSFVQTLGTTGCRIYQF
jgi:hypothetical protein